MRVVHLSTTDFWEQGLGAYRIHKGVQKMGIKSFLITLLKSSGDPSVGMLIQDPLNRTQFRVRKKASINIPSFFTDILESWRDELDVKIMSWEGEISCSIGNSPINWSEIKELNAADVIHIHWSPGMLNFEALPLYFMGKPVVITCYDYSFLTGVCHYPGNCLGFMEGCTNCPVVVEEKREIVSREYTLKYKSYELINPFVVVQSSAMKKKYGNFFDRIKIVYPSTSFYSFSREPKKKMREVLGLPSDAMILISVAPSMMNPRKGFEKILKIADRLKSRINIYVILIGADMYELPGNISLPLHKIGTLPSEEILSWYYMASDIFIMPAEDESFSLFVLDAMAMGVPVVGYGKGILDDIVTSGKDGYIVPPGDIESLVEKIFNIYSSPKMLSSMHRASREKIEKKFTMDIQARNYVAIYEEIVKEKEKLSLSKWVQWGEELFMANKREFALRCFEKLLEVDENNPDLLNNIGVLYWEAGRYQRAREFFKKAYEIAPDNPSVKENYEKSHK